MNRWLTTVAISATVAAAGCGVEAKQRDIDPLGAAQAGDQDKIKEALKKAGIDRGVVAIVDANEEWLVTLTFEGGGPNGEPPPGTRPMPDQALVHKQTFAVKRMDAPGGRGGSGRQTGGREFDPTKPSKS